MLFLDMQQHLIKMGTFANLAALQDVVANYGRSLEAADRMKATKLDDGATKTHTHFMDIDDDDSHPARRWVDNRVAGNAGKKAAKRARLAHNNAKGDQPKKRKFTGTIGVGKPPSPCFNCGGDHWTKDCKKPKDNSGASKKKFVPKSKANPNGTLTKKQLWEQGRCFKCGETGHNSESAICECNSIPKALRDLQADGTFNNFSCYNPTCMESE